MMTRLRNRLILAFVLVLFIPTAIITIYGSVTISNQLVETARTTALQTNRRTAASIVNFLNRARSDVLVLSHASGATNYVDTVAASDTQGARSALASIQTTLLAYFQNVPIYDQISFLDQDGQEIVRVQQSQGRAVLLARNNLENRGNEAYFKEALDRFEGEVYISPLSLKTVGGQIEEPYTPVIHFSTPVFSTLGSLGGVMTATLLAEPLGALIEANNPGERAYLIDADGTYLAGPDTSQLYGRDLGTGITLRSSLPNDAASILTGAEGTLFGTRDRPGLLQVFTRISLPDQEGIQWTLYYTQLADNILGTIENARLVIVGLAGAALVLAIAVALIMTRSITRPIEALTRSAIAIAGGDLTQRVVSNDRGEIGALANAFNRMGEQLTVSYTTLERRVEERTAQLAEAQRRAETASKAKSIFLSNMSHELRTPLNVVIGYTSSMLDMPQMYDNLPLPEMYRKDIRLIMDNGRHLLGLINDILDLSKIEAGRLELHRTEVDLIEIFQGVMATAVGLAKDKPVQVRPDYPPDLPLVWADPMRVRQIILNLMSNAVKFTEMGSITLRARSEGDFIRIAVIDTGIGIPEKALRSIFDRYAQAEQDHDKHYAGTGLGLDISKQLTQMHGGELTVESVVGQGSTFAFTLPIAQVETIQAPRQPEPQERVSVIFDNVEVEAEPQSVLLIENDTALRNRIRRTLEEAGYIVVDADNDAQAVEIALGLLPDIIVLDAQLSEADGWAVFDQLRAQSDTASIPVIVFGTAPVPKYPEAPNLKYMQKPIAPDWFLTYMRAMLAQPTSIMEDKS